MSEPILKTELIDQVAVWTLNRPEVMNAFNFDLLHALKAAVDIITGRDQLTDGGRLTAVELKNNARAFEHMDKTGMVKEVTNGGLIDAAVKDVLAMSAAERERTIVITAPHDLRQNHELLAAVAAKGETLAIFMGLKDLPNLVRLLKRHYAETVPMRLVYAAGISNREHQVSTTLGQALKAVEHETERFLGLVYIGPCLKEGSPSCP